eukprot:Gb_22918 [translate_table: standard]
MRPPPRNPNSHATKIAARQPVGPVNNLPRVGPNPKVWTVLTARWCNGGLHRPCRAHMLRGGGLQCVFFALREPKRTRNLPRKLAAAVVFLPFQFQKGFRLNGFYFALG